MKRYSNLPVILLAFFLTLSFAGRGYGQTDEPNYVFVIFETTVTRQGVETSDINPEERRFYVSNVVAIPSADPALLRRASKLADDYFTAAVVEPMKATGILHQYYDDGIRINDDVVYRLDTRAEVEDLQKKALADLREQSASVFTFTWSYGENAGGLETARPTLVYHHPEEPLYGAAEPKTAAPKATPAGARVPVKKSGQRH